MPFERDIDLRTLGTTRRVNGVYECQNVVDGCGGEHAVAEVEDVSRPSPRTAQDPVRVLFDQRDRAEQNGRVEVALNGHLVAEPVPSLVQVDAPVEADHLAS